MSRTTASQEFRELLVELGGEAPPPAGMPGMPPRVAVLMWLTTTSAFALLLFALGYFGG
ncbi:hypothetical protein OV079_23685 [Nannocystis pusilla]|uniref:Uncharacterized protein n=1 Tax=Nannocystis pusilla TaxID=889268 RepID=A0A9X3EH67_9BACT|nr:hypothetical protein [Nannocystis pusilla]MCY1003977.1 hypothetical protein [Nannocystis pusilla]MCY1008504.1 hypothetical protein [Nannocystis pusilla]